MNNELDIIQYRRNNGDIEYRQRLTIHGSQLDHIPKLIVTKEWGPWRPIDAVVGDETDRRFE